MKFVINTNYKNSAGKTVLDGVVRRLQNDGHTVSHNDWDHYENYDVAIFMAPDSKVRDAKKKSKTIVCGIFDPKVSRSYQISDNRIADFLIVGSIEQRDFFLKYNKNIFIYYMFPDILDSKKDHTHKKKIIIGYHGNKQHLDAMSEVSSALDTVATKYDIELHAIYNIKKLGKWTQNTPKVCKVSHIQWAEDTVATNVSACDVGIVPSALPVPKLFSRPLRSFFYNPESYNKNDYVSRFKMSNNPGRIYVFSQLGVPVVADFTPSAAQIIQDEYSGYLVGTKEGWVSALEKLITDTTIRANFSTNLKKYINENCSTESNFKNLMTFISKVQSNGQ